MDMNRSKPRFSVVIPVYNSSQTLKVLADHISVVMEKQPDPTWELFFVDDRSTDPQTWKTIRKIAYQRKEVKGIRLRKNAGQHQATLCGMSLASGDIIITMDDDMQHDPHHIPLLLDQTGADAVIAVFDHKEQGYFRNLTSRIKEFFDRIILKNPPDIKLNSTFRAIKWEVVSEMLKIHTSFPLVNSMIWSVTENIVNVDLKHNPRINGSSSYSFFKRLALFSNLVFNHSSLILKFMSRLGFVSALGGIGFGFFLAARKILFGNVVQGWTSLEVTILVLGGLILLSTGVIGEYLYRILVAVEVRPRFVIESVLNLDERKDLNCWSKGKHTNDIE